MPAPSILTKPQKGDDVRKLWVHVDKLVRKVDQQQIEINRLNAKIPTRRRMDTPPVVGSSLQVWI